MTGNPPSKRILVTGLSTYWGSRLARELEQNEDIEAIIGVDSADPAGELERTEFVRVGTQHALLRRVVEAAEIDTVIDTRLVVDSTVTTPRRAHENNVIGTTGMSNSRVCEVFTSGPRTLANRKTVTVASGFFSRNSATEASASTMSRSIGVPAACGRPIVSVKNAGSSCCAP